MAVCLYDNKRAVGGMNHFCFPFIADKGKATARYGNVATVALVRMMMEGGSKRDHLEAQIFGGAHNQEISTENVGYRNYQAAKKMLLREGVAVVSQDVGGRKGRKVVFNTVNNEIAVIKVEKLRKSDWYPYEGDR